MTSSVSPQEDPQPASGSPADLTRPSGVHPPRPGHLVVVWAVLRTLLTVAFIVALYYLVPFDHGMSDATAVGLVLGAVALAAIVVLQIWTISRSKYPTLRAIEALAFSVPLYILLFASAYFLMQRAQQASFGVHLSRTDAMYFSSTVFTTVGFGDITAKSETARLVVTLQMMLDLVAVGLVVRLVVNAIKLGQQRHAVSNA
jgi:voltage-gated potassium channel